VNVGPGGRVPAVTIDVHPALRPIVRLRWGSCAPVRVRAADAALDEAMTAAAAAVRTAAEPAAITAAVRAMYRRTGVDPTKTRPSSEALWRRVRKGGELPRINTLVDIINWCSLETQLPFGLYDEHRIETPVILRLGGPGEEYAGIRKDAVHLEGRLALTDAAGPFGNPTSDSARTMVTLETTAVLVVVYAPAGLDPAVADRALALTTDRIVRFSA
jgi:DNA/RNA-binding domain of Phe-tRNA-synthetase-like protein